ncbi:radical SAM protein [Fibrobacter succinogenes]|uniref:radical SAM protein n=1 Tax=Fibrobacter succinogenes TaxID=833 RepID=UPI001567E34E|nr:radical SAM protein [Fibrobacter succinogenes]
MEMNQKKKKVLLIHIPLSICNFRCHYCYIAQRAVHFQGIQPQIDYTPEQVAYALRPERLGGPCFINMCAAGETLLTNNLAKYVKALCKEGHFVEVVTNLSVSKALDEFLSWDKDLLKHLEFKCSFHYLELKKKNLLDKFAENVNKIWNAGASANIEITPSDELIPYIEEVKEFSIKHFGALPHLTIARNDNTNQIERLTKLPLDEYNKTWSQFGSEFWEFKTSIFGKKQNNFCYAGAWSAYINLATGEATACYCKPSLGNVFENPDAPFPEIPVGKCPIAHCYNGHALMTQGLIPHTYEVCYGQIRDRVKEGGGHWLQPELKAFFDEKLIDNNKEWSNIHKRVYVKTSKVKELAIRVLQKLHIKK